MTTGNNEEALRRLFFVAVFIPFGWVDMVGAEPVITAPADPETLVTWHPEGPTRRRRR